MVEKRRYDDNADQGGPSAKRYKGNGGSGSGQQQQRFKKNAPKPESSNWAKKRARTIERRLRNPDGLPANVQRDLERELASLSRQIDGRKEKMQRAHMIKKYHMLRFFERKKAARLQSQLLKRIQETEDPAERAVHEADQRIAEVDILYTKYFPFLEPYVSLYPLGNKKEAGGHDSEDDESGAGKKLSKGAKIKKEASGGKQSSAAQALRAPRPPMWSVIETTWHEGGLRALERLRDRKPDTVGKAAENDETKKKTENKADKKKADGKGKDRRAGASSHSNAPEVKMEDADSDDGGFFEEV